MLTDIQYLKQDYAKFQSILPEEIKDSLLFDLENAKSRILTIIENDQNNVKVLIKNKNKNFRFDKFENMHYLIKKGFLHENDTETVSYFYAQWMMTQIAIRILCENVILLYKNLLRYREEYLEASDKRTKIHTYIRSHQDFFGVISSMNHTIEQYNDALVVLNNKVEPSNTQKTIYSTKADSDFDSLRQTVIDLLLGGNIGKLNGLPILRSSIEVYIYDILFSLKEDSKYSNVHVNDWMKVLNGILGCIKRNNLAIFESDALNKLYDYQSKVVHRGFRTDDYILWYLHHYIYFLAGNFSQLKQYQDLILDDLERHNIVTLTMKNEP